MTKLITITTSLLLVSLVASSCNDGCIKCSSANQCLMCDFNAGYVIASLGCNLKLLSNCLFRSINGNCLLCSENYYVDVQLHKCVEISKNSRIDNCKYYADAASCSQCSTGYYLTNRKCQKVSTSIINCVNALGPSLCQECASGYLLSADNTTCIQIKPVSSCMVYSSIECKKCNEGYAFNRNALLYLLRDFLTSDSPVDNAKAFALTSTDTLITAFRCSKITLKNCKTMIDFETCTQCDDGYYIGPDANCIKNPSSAIANCSSYLAINICTECAQGYYLKDSTTCEAITSIDNCIVYNGKATSTQCILCVSDYYLSGGTSCVKRTIYPDSCITYGTTFDGCAVCISDNVPTSDKHKCLPAIRFCEEYVSSSFNDTALTCTRCRNRFYWSGSNCDLGTTSNCLRYISTNICELCEDGYYLDNNNKCVAHKKTMYCNNYSNYVADVCLQCNERSMSFELLTECVEVYVKGCEVYTNETQCERCQEGYNLESDRSCTLIGTEFNCRRQILGKCVVCNEGYLLDNDECTFPTQNFNKDCLKNNIDGTIINDNKECIKCNNGAIFYNYKDHYQCMDAEYLKGIYTNILEPACQGYKIFNNGLKCNKCHPGFYLEEDNCVTSCSSGYALRPVEIEYSLGNNNYNISKVDVCVPHNHCAIQYPLISQNPESDIRYGCVKCLNEFHNIINIDLNESMIVKGVHIKGSDKNLLLTHSSATCDNVSLVRKGEVNNCRYYYHLIDESIGCLNCDFGYSGVVANFVVDHCHEYNNTLEFCVKCQQGYYRKNAYECVPVEPIIGCKLYSITHNHSYCVKCKSDDQMYYIDNGTCILIDDLIPNCQLYSLDSASCDVCQDTYLLNTDKTVCYNQITNCLVQNEVADRDTIPTCQKCEYRYLPNVDFTECLAQDFESPCWEYEHTVDGQCVRHNLVPFLVNVTCQEVSNIYGCVEYDNDDVSQCTKCDTSKYYLHNNKCVTYGKYLDADGAEQLISITNCMVSRHVSGVNCDKCNDKTFHVVDESENEYCCMNNSFLLNGQCTQDILLTYNNFNCSVYDVKRRECILCSDDFYITKGDCCALGDYFKLSTNACENIQTDLTINNCLRVHADDITACIECDDAFLLTYGHCCSAGKYWNGTDCANFPDNCIEVSQNGICTKCEEDNYAVDEKCCANGEFYDATEDVETCVDIPDNLTNCIQYDGTDCLKCSQSHFLDALHKVCCPEGTHYYDGSCVNTNVFYMFCEDISANADKGCEKCHFMFYLYKGLCTPLSHYIPNVLNGHPVPIEDLGISNCNKVDNDNNCIECINDTYAIINEEAIKVCCPNGTLWIRNECLSLHALFNECVSFDWNSLKCISCTIDVESDSILYPYKGICVPQGSYIKDGSSSAISITKCLEFDDNDMCTKCQFGTKLTPATDPADSPTCENNLCKEFDGEDCIECETGYILNNQTSTCISNEEFVALNDSSTCADVFTYCKSFNFTNNPCDCESCKDFTYGTQQTSKQLCCPYGTKLAGNGTCENLVIVQCASVDSSDGNCNKCFIDDDNCTTQTDYILNSNNIVNADGSIITLSYTSYNDYRINYLSNGACCRRGYYKASASQCVKIPYTNCAELNEQNNCSICHDEYYIASTNICCKYNEIYDNVNKKCVNDPSVHGCRDGQYKSNGHCCKEKYYWNLTTYRCEPLLDIKCLKSDSLSTCNKCDNGYKLDFTRVYAFSLGREHVNNRCNNSKYDIFKSLCVPVAQDISPLISNNLLVDNCTQLDIATKECSTCHHQAYKDENDSNCCSDNFFNINNYCTSINTFLDGCINYSNSSKECLECAYDYQLQKGICCKSGHFFNSADKGCTSYKPYCKEFNVDTQVCVTCTQDAYIQGNTCCPLSTYLNSSNNKCEKPTYDNFAHCLIFFNHYICLKCNESAGVYLSNGQCCKLGYENNSSLDSGNELPCTVISEPNCAQTDATGCIKCASNDMYLIENSGCCNKGYFFDGTCKIGNTKDPNCSEFVKNGTSCLTCKQSDKGVLYVSNGKCCEESYYYNTEKEQCLPINKRELAYCNTLDNSDCTGCDNGYYLNSNYHTCCAQGTYWNESKCIEIENISNCIRTYDDAEEQGCIKCSPSHVLVDKECVPDASFISGCVKGHVDADINKCDECVIDRNLYLDNTVCCGGSEYFNNELQQCVSILHCAAFNYELQICVLCNSDANYYLAINNPDCCIEGQWYNYKTGLCDNITDKIACIRKSNNISTDTGECIKCAMNISDSYYIYDENLSTCVEQDVVFGVDDLTEDKYLSCPDNKVLDISDRTCEDRIDLVTDCDKYNLYSEGCVQCAPNFITKYNNSQYITECVDKSTANNCAVFTGTDTCIHCAKGYYLNVDTCTSISDQNCKFNYATRDTCYECNDDYYISPEDGKCNERTNSKASVNCVSKSPKHDYCLKCAKGYRLNITGACVLANVFPNCKKPSDYIDYCEECEDGFIIIYNEVPTETSATAATNMCVDASTISDHIVGCYKYNDRYLCTECISIVPNDATEISIQAYYLDESTCKIVTYVENCKQYEKQSDECLECKTGFYLDVNICSPRSVITNCETYKKNANECEKCKNGYINGNTSCDIVDLVADCKIYDALTGDCSECHIDSYLDNDECIPRTLTSNCELYSKTDNICSQCQIGYFLNAFSDDIRACLRHTPVVLCHVYKTDANECEECAPGYNLSQNRCEPISTDDLIQNCRAVSELGFYCNNNSACTKHYTCADNSDCTFYSNCLNGDKCVIGESCGDGEICTSATKCSDGTSCNSYDICSDGKLCPIRGECFSGDLCTLTNLCSNGDTCDKLIKTCPNHDICNTDSDCDGVPSSCLVRPSCSDCNLDSYHSSLSVCSERQQVDYSIDCMILDENADACIICNNYDTNFFDGNTEACVTRTNTDCFIMDVKTDVCIYCKENYFYSQDVCTVRDSPNEDFIYSQESADIIGCKQSTAYLTGTSCIARTLIPGCINYYSENDDCLLCAHRTHYIDNGECFEYDINISTSLEGSPTIQDLCKIFSTNANSCEHLHSSYYFDNDEVKQILNCFTINATSKNCSVCEKGYYLTETYQCAAVNIPDCKDYITNQKECSQCTDGFYLSNGNCCEVSSYYDYIYLDKCVPINNEELIGCNRIDGNNCLGCHDDDDYYHTNEHCCLSGSYWDVELEAINKCTIIDSITQPNCVKFDSGKCVECNNSTILTFDHCCDSEEFWNSEAQTPQCESNSTSDNSLCERFAHDSFICIDCGSGKYNSNGKCCPEGQYHNGSECVAIDLATCLQLSNSVCLKCTTDASNDGKCCLGNGTVQSTHFVEGQGCVNNPSGCHDYNGSCINCRGNIASANANYESEIQVNSSIGCCAANNYYKPSTDTCVLIENPDLAISGNCILAESLDNCLKCSEDKVIRNGLCTNPTNFMVNDTLRPFNMIKNICKRLKPNGECSLCQDGYYPTSGVCCRLGQYWNGSFCITIPIALCNKGNDTTCTECNEGFSLQNLGAVCCSNSEILSGGNCEQSEILNCIKITTDKCTTCAPGYHIDNDGNTCCPVGTEYVAAYDECKILNQSIENCKHFDNLTLSCHIDGCDLDGNYYLSDGFCCKKGTMWNRSTLSCVPIVEKNCAVYDALTKVCSECLADMNLYLFDNKCCVKGTYWNVKGKTCVDISLPYCLKYDGVLNRCIDCGNYNLYNGVCCSDNFFYKDTDIDLVCKPLIDNCAKYNQDGTCALCSKYQLVAGNNACCPENTFYEGSTKECLSSIKVENGCKKFDPETLSCISCIDRYALYKGVCCPYGEYYDYDSRDCKSINDDLDVADCEIVVVEDTECIKCKDSHYLNEDTECQLKPSNCIDVSKDGKCSSCDNNHYVHLDHCCEIGQYYDNIDGCVSIEIAECVQLNNNSNCFTCSKNHYLTNDICCAYGEYFDDNTCKAGLIPNCAEYDNKENCSKCNPNYAIYSSFDGENIYAKCFPITIEDCVEADISEQVYNDSTFNAISCTYCKNNGISFSRNHITSYFEYFEFRDLDSQEDKPYNNQDGDTCLNYDITNTLATSTFKCLLCEKNKENYANDNICTARTVNNLDKCTRYSETSDECTECVDDYYLKEGVCSIFPNLDCAVYDPVRDECRHCKDEFSITYRTNDDKNSCNIDYGISADKDPLYYSGYITSCSPMTDCSTMMYEGMDPNLEYLFSCHKCKSNTKIPFVAIAAGDDFTKKIGLQQYYILSEGTFDEGKLGFSTTCVKPVAATFELVENEFKFPANCGLGMINADLPASATHSTDPTVLDKSLLSIFCVACKPGFKPSRNADLALHVYQCTAIVQCDESTRINGCTSCKAGYRLKYTDKNGTDYSSCVPSTDSNCYAAYNGVNNNRCGVCKKGYSLNPDGLCEIINTVFCEVNNFNFMNGFGLEDFEVILRNNEYGAGCHNCQKGFVGVYEYKDNYQCTKSRYIYAGKYVTGTVFDVNCYFYGHRNGINYCEACNLNYIITENNKCIPLTDQLNGCSIAKDAFKCTICVDGYSLLNSICVKHNKSNCSAYDDYPANNTMTCVECFNGFYLENNNCYKGKILDCDVYSNKDVCNKCKPGLALIHLKDNETACYPISSHPNCNQYNNDINFGQIICQQCSGNNYLLRFQAVPVRICDPVRLINYCMAYDIGNSFAESTLRCRQCVDGYYLSNNVCLSRTLQIDNCDKYMIDSLQCEECNSAYYLNIDRTACIEAPTGIPGCKVYVSATKCSYCEYRKYLKDDKCLSVDQSVNIPSCEFYISATECGGCVSGYIFKDKACVAAVAKNCLAYSSETACSSCSNGFVIKEEAGVSSCVAKSALINCSLTTDTLPATCLECKSGFYADSTGNCTAITTAIANCEVYNSENTCSACLSGHLLILNSFLCISYMNDDGCARRYALDTSVCVVCNPGFDLAEDFTCKSVNVASNLTGCRFTDPKDPSICIVCKSGYRQQVNGVCVLARFSEGSALDSVLIISSLVLAIMLAIFYS